MNAPESVFRVEKHQGLNDGAVLDRDAAIAWATERWIAGLKIILRRNRFGHEERRQLESLARRVLDGMLPL